MLDTDVWSALFVTTARRDGRADRWRRALTGVDIVIATQTRAESLAGALAARWGPARIVQLRAQLAATATVPADDAVVEAYAWLTADCRQAGHPLYQRVRAADRWVAATAITTDLPLLSGDGVYAGAPRLRLFPQEAE